MKTALVFTVLSKDHPGVVEAISEVLAEHGANWEESRMAHLAGHFAGIVRASVNAESAAAVSAALCKLGEQGVSVVVEPTAEPTRAGSRSVDIELVGQDHPGIIHEISHALASEGINVEQLETEVKSANMAGSMLFHARARVQLPASMETDAIRALLEGLANDLMVDIEVEEETQG